MNVVRQANTEITGAELVARLLQEYSVTHVFFVDAMLRMSLGVMDRIGIQPVLCHSEASAAYMADGYARVTRRPGVCMAQSVGAANLAAGLQDAFLAQSSVLAITGRQHPQRQHRNAYQEIPHESLFKDVTKFTARMEAPLQIQHLFRQAFRECTSGTPRPVHLDLLHYKGDDTENCVLSEPIVTEKRFCSVPAFRTQADPSDIQTAADLINRAVRPCIMAGVGAVVSGAEEAIAKLVEKISAVFVCTVDAKGCLVDSHPLNAGPSGTYSRACANQLLSEADLVIFLGCDTGDQVTNLWTNPVPGDVATIQMDPDASEIGRNYPGSYGVQADIKLGVEQLLAKVSSSPRDAWRARIGSVVKAWREELHPHVYSQSSLMRPERLCRELGEVLPQDVVVVADTGYSAVWTGMFLPISAPTQTFMRAAGSLGWAFPAALGAKCGVPQRPVVCFTGDGGMYYHLQELETARRCGINAVTVVNNNSHMLPARIIDQMYGPSNPSRKFLELRETNFANLAKEFGCLGIRVENAADFKPAFQKALAAEVPVVIDVVSDHHAHPPPIWKP
jgi:acetolactate synthase-1/2/3 large subunit